MVGAVLKIHRKYNTDFDKYGYTILVPVSQYNTASRRF